MSQQHHFRATCTCTGVREDRAHAGRRGGTPGPCLWSGDGLRWHRNGRETAAPRGAGPPGEGLQRISAPGHFGARGRRPARPVRPRWKLGTSLATCVQSRCARTGLTASPQGRASRRPVGSPKPFCVCMRLGTPGGPPQTRGPCSPPLLSCLRVLTCAPTRGSHPEAGHGARAGLRQDGVPGSRITAQGVRDSPPEGGRRAPVS